VETFGAIGPRTHPWGPARLNEKPTRLEKAVAQFAQQHAKM
jgi:hypothetical protein